MLWLLVVCYYRSNLSHEGFTCVMTKNITCSFETSVLCSQVTYFGINKGIQDSFTCLQCNKDKEVEPSAPCICIIARKPVVSNLAILPCAIICMIAVQQGRGKEQSRSCFMHYARKPVRINSYPCNLYTCWSLQLYWNAFKSSFALHDEVGGIKA